MSGIYDTFGGNLITDVRSFKPDALAPDTLVICMKRGEHRVADDLRKAFGGFMHVVIDVDGEQHEFSADSLIRLLESYEDASRYSELFGTPERAARTLEEFELDNLNWCHGAEGCEKCPYEFDRYGCYLPDGFELLEWLRGDA